MGRSDLLYEFQVDHWILSKFSVSWWKLLLEKGHMFWGIPLGYKYIMCVCVHAYAHAVDTIFMFYE